MLCNYVTNVPQLSLPNEFCLASSRNQYQLRIAKHITQIRKDRYSFSMMTYSRQSEQILHRNEKYILECEKILFGNLLLTSQRSSLLLSSV